MRESVDQLTIEKAKKLMAEGLGREQVAKRIGLSCHLLRCALDPDFRRRRALSTRQRRREFQDEYSLRRKYKDDETLQRKLPDHATRAMTVSSDILEERDRRLSIPYRDFTSQFMGDPRPGCSALDKKQKVFGQ